MANTEGLPDEILPSLLAVPLPATSKRDISKSARFPRRSLMQREHMMDLGKGERPAATVIRSSVPPTISHSASLKRAPKDTEVSNKAFTKSKTNDVIDLNVDEMDHSIGKCSSTRNMRPVILSETVLERPAIFSLKNDQLNLHMSSTAGARSEKSRFKKSICNKDGPKTSCGHLAPTAGGFPSLAYGPVGSLTRKRRQKKSQNCTDAFANRTRHSADTTTPSQESTLKNDYCDYEIGSDSIDRASNLMFKNMSEIEIHDGIEEVKSSLSSDLIEFLTKRGRLKLLKSEGAMMDGAQPLPLRNSSLQPTYSSSSHSVLSQNITDVKDERRVRDNKYLTARLLSQVSSPDDMDGAYKEALKLGLAAELPAGAIENNFETLATSEANEPLELKADRLRIATLLLRSTAPRQRLLGARFVCSTTEEDADAMLKKRYVGPLSDSKSDKLSTRAHYPPLLPVTLRCLLDQSIALSQKSVGRELISLALRSIHALMIIFVHPYHVVCVTRRAISSDLFAVSQTCYMNDVSHTPASVDLYPAIFTKPVVGGDDASYYRIDSSMASADSDSNSFYCDPAWVLLSQMRILPCLEVVLSLFSRVTMPIQAIESICGILAMLAVRSQGAASVIANNEKLLPFLASYCLSPSTRAFEGNLYDDNCDLFGALCDEEEKKRNRFIIEPVVALPALILLCTIAKQSKDIAHLEAPFETIISDLQAILCMESAHSEESEIQIWSLILLRTLTKYGLAIKHSSHLVQSAALHLASPQLSEYNLAAEYLTVFANICDCAKSYSSLLRQRGEREMQTAPKLSEYLAMSGMWLSSTANKCVTSLLSLKVVDVDNNLDTDMILPRAKLLTAQIKLLAAYTSASTPTNILSNYVLPDQTSSVAIVSKESCVAVFDSVLQSGCLPYVLDISLQYAFCVNWDSSCVPKKRSPSQEAHSCAFVSSFFKFVSVHTHERCDDDRRFLPLNTRLYEIILDSLRKSSSIHRSVSFDGDEVHIARRSWFIEAEFSVLKCLCQISPRTFSYWRLVREYAFSLVGRLTVGYEGFASFIFNENRLFAIDGTTKVTRTLAEHSLSSLQTALLRELNWSAYNKSQLDHSLNLCSSDINFHPNTAPFSLSSLRSNISFTRKVEDSETDKLLLPIGGIWLWNVLSSVVIHPVHESQSNAQISQKTAETVSQIVSHCLCLQLESEALPRVSSYPSCLNNGTKLYHLANVCLFPENIMRDEITITCLMQLTKQLIGWERDCSSCGFDSLVEEFINACLRHSRIAGIGTEKQSLRITPSNGQVIPKSLTDSKETALRDFVDDMCDTYIGYGGQYQVFSMFMRFFLSNGFPVKIISLVLKKLHDVLHLLSLEEERSQTFFSLVQSISGGLPSMDSSQRDRGSILDSFSASLKNRSNELFRSDYIYMLAIAFLSRNLASSFQRCDCGLQAMKRRLIGVRSSTFYDIVMVSKLLLCSKSGEKEDLIGCVFSVCSDTANALSSQDNHVQEGWLWNCRSETSTWNKALKALQDSLPEDKQ